jgi:hypothetical protein
MRRFSSSFAANGIADLDFSLPWSYESCFDESCIDRPGTHIRTYHKHNRVADDVVVAALSLPIPLPSRGICAQDIDLTGFIAGISKNLPANSLLAGN